LYKKETIQSESVLSKYFIERKPAVIKSLRVTAQKKIFLNFPPPGKKKRAPKFFWATTNQFLNWFPNVIIKDNNVHPLEQPSPNPEESEPG